MINFVPPKMYFNFLDFRRKIKKGPNQPTCQTGPFFLAHLADRMRSHGATMDDHLPPHVHNLYVQQWKPHLFPSSFMPFNTLKRLDFNIKVTPN
jgi:hypothetical protein